MDWAGLVQDESLLTSLAQILMLYRLILKDISLRHAILFGKCQLTQFLVNRKLTLWGAAFVGVVVNEGVIPCAPSLNLILNHLLYRTLCSDGMFER